MSQAVTLKLKIEKELDVRTLGDASLVRETSSSTGDQTGTIKERISLDKVSRLLLRYPIHTWDAPRLPSFMK